MSASLSRCSACFILLCGFVPGVPAHATAPQRVDSCPILLDELRQNALADMERKVDAAMEDALSWGLCRYQYIDYCPICSGAGGGYELTVSPTTDSAAEYSETNVQVSGVDEADFIKNDGGYIYMLGSEGLSIIDAWPPEQAHVISRTPIESQGSLRKLFVHNGYAWIYSSLDNLRQGTDEYLSYFREAPENECTYGYDCDFTGDGRRLKVTVLDIHDLTAPRLVREMYFPGSYLNSRRINEAVYSALVFPQLKIDGLRYWPDALFEYGYACTQDISETEIIAMFNALKEKNRALIEAADFSTLLPQVRDIRYAADGSTVASERLLQSCEAYVAPERDGLNFVSLVATTIDGDSDLHAATIVGRPGAVYASADALYIASRHSRDSVQNNWYFAPESGVTEAGTIYKFALEQNPPAVTYRAGGVVKGRVLNQFALDENQGYLRIATTTGHLPDPDTHSSLFVLEQQGDALVEVGVLDAIAPGEDIRSVRFVGDKGYVVTFKKTDPLFVFDLSEPTQPRITGELKIPGFSTYIHPLDADHLLSIGYDADDQGSFAWFQGIMLQIFDVSDMRQPLLTHKAVIGSRGSSSEAATNHLAFNYFAARGLLAIPMNVCEGEGSGGSYGDRMTFSGLLVYRVDGSQGFELLGGIPHNAPEAEGVSYGRCYNWWTQADSYVKRSVFLEDYAFSVSADSLKAAHIDSLEQPLALIDLDRAPVCDAFHVHLCRDENACLRQNARWNNGICLPPALNPRVARSIKDLCEASYDPLSGVLDLPCVEAGGVQHQAALHYLGDNPVRLALDKAQSASVRAVSSGNCALQYNPASTTLHLPCVDISGSLYQADFNVLGGDRFILELAGIRGR